MGAGTWQQAGDVRAGGRVLALLSDGLNVSIVRALARGPVPTLELPGRVGPASRTTRFSRLRSLETLGVISREKRGGLPPVTYCGLSPSGEALLPVVRRFAAWLGSRPADTEGRRRMDDILAIKGLAAGWGTTALRWLAEGPQTVTDLASRCSPQSTYHDVRWARTALADANLVEMVDRPGRGRPFALSDWARGAVGPLAAAARWERDFLIGAAGVLSPIESETLLLLAISLTGDLPGALSGICMLHVDDQRGIRVAVDEGRVVFFSPDSQNGRRCSVSGSSEAWLDALVDGRRSGLEMRGGALRLPMMVIAGLQGVCA